MNENASEQGSVTGKAVANILGLSAAAALSVGAGYAGVAGIKKIAKGVTGSVKGMADTAVSAVRNAQDGTVAGAIKNFGKKNNGGLLDNIPVHKNFKAGDSGVTDVKLKTNPTSTKRSKKRKKRK